MGFKKRLMGKLLHLQHFHKHRDALLSWSLISIGLFRVVGLTFPYIALKT